MDGVAKIQSVSLNTSGESLDICSFLFSFFLFSKFMIKLSLTSFLYQKIFFDVALLFLSNDLILFLNILNLLNKPSKL
jgi:hypothetical protein